MSERACYALLLLHGVWGESGEAGLLGDCTTATSKYNEIHGLGSNLGGFPEYVRRSLEKRIASETLLADTGTPLVSSSTAGTAEEFDQLLADQADEMDDSSQFLHQSILTDVSAAPLSDHHGHNVFNCPTSQLAYLGNFVANLKKAHKLAHTNANVCSESELVLKVAEPSRVIEIDNAELERDALENSIRTLNEEQRVAFDVAHDCISGVNPQQLIMFLSGEGGTGKSHLIHTVTKYTQILRGKSEGWYGAVLKTAPTGGSAYNIKGHTWHSALGKTTFKRLTKKSLLSDQQTGSLQRNLKGVSLFILDEISLLSLEDLYEISFRLSTATGF
jgi:hypothetical protein